MILTAKLGAVINIRVSVLSITQLLKPKLFGLGNCRSFVAYRQRITFVGHTMGKGSFLRLLTGTIVVCRMIKTDMKEGITGTMRADREIKAAAGKLSRSLDITFISVVNISIICLFRSSPIQLMSLRWMCQKSSDCTGYW